MDYDIYEAQKTMENTEEQKKISERVCANKAYQFKKPYTSEDNIEQQQKEDKTFVLDQIIDKNEVV